MQKVVAAQCASLKKSQQLNVRRCKSYGGPITIEAFDIIGKVVMFKQELNYLHRWKRCAFDPGAGGVLIGLIGLCLLRNREI